MKTRVIIYLNYLEYNEFDFCVHDYVIQLIAFISERKSTTPEIEETSTPTESASTIATSGTLWSKFEN